MQRILRFVIFGLALTALAVTGFMPSRVSAHEQRDVVGGKYHVVIGWLDEPAYTGFKNSLDLRITDPSLATPVAGETATNGIEGLESTLQVEIIYGDQKKTLTLEPRWRTPGAYNAWIVPMAAGDYTFHVFGTINGDAIDESFTSSPEGFSSVDDASTIQFPSESAQTGTVAGMTIGDSAGSIGTGGIAGGMFAVLAIGAAGVWLVRQRGMTARRQSLRPAGMSASVGD